MENELVPEEGGGKPPVPPKEPVSDETESGSVEDSKAVSAEGSSAEAADAKSETATPQKTDAEKQKAAKLKAKKIAAKKAAAKEKAAKEKAAEPAADDMSMDTGEEAPREKPASAEKADAAPEAAEDQDEGEGASAEVDEKQKDKDQRMERNARRILSAISRHMPVIAPHLRLKGGRDKVANEVKIPYLDKFSGMVQSSYVTVPGRKEKLLYFAILNGKLFQIIKEILVTDTELRDQLCEETVMIQFGCPKVGKGLLFKKVSKGFLRGKRVAMYTFDLKKEQEKGS